MQNVLILYDRSLFIADKQGFEGPDCDPRSSRGVWCGVLGDYVLLRTSSQRPTLELHVLSSATLQHLRVLELDAAGGAAPFVCGNALLVAEISGRAAGSAPEAEPEPEMEQEGPAVHDGTGGDPGCTFKAVFVTLRSKTVSCRLYLIFFGIYAAVCYSLALPPNMTSVLLCCC